MAYAAEMADMEDRRRISWASTWATIRDRAKMILEKCLNDNLKEGEDGFPIIPKMTVEIDIEDHDGQELYDELSDTEY